MNCNRSQQDLNTKLNSEIKDRKDKITKNEDNLQGVGELAHQLMHSLADMMTEIDMSLIDPRALNCHLTHQPGKFIRRTVPRVVDKYWYRWSGDIRFMEFYIEERMSQTRGRSPNNGRCTGECHRPEFTTFLKNIRSTRGASA